VVLAVVVLLPWVVLVALSLRLWSTPASAGPVAAAPKAMSSTKRHCKPGPWGEIEYFDLVTQPPDEFISASFFSDVHPRWVFKGFSKETLSELLAATDVTETQRKAIESSAESPAAGDQCVVKPPADLILGLSAKARARIYAVLAKFPENSAQRDPFIFRPSQINAWLAKSGLAPSTVELVEGLLYVHGDRLLLADCSTLLKQIPDAAERLRLLRVLFRREAVFPRLRVTPSSDVKELTGYWGKGGRGIAVGPLLDSIPPRAEGITVDIALLLPPFARDRLYTYPMPTTSAQTASHDCHWSALNFFNETPDERFTRADVIRATIESDYYPVPGRPSFGDVALFFAPDQSIVHSAVYIADDILFTRNGTSFTSPWLLMTEAEVRACFPAYEKLNVTYYRLKKL